MSVSNERRMVSPQEAQHDDELNESAPTRSDLVHTVATEPERIRAAVVKVLRDVANLDRAWLGGEDELLNFLDERAAAIENGADW